MRLSRSTIAFLILLSRSLIPSAVADYSPYHSPFNDDTYLLSNAEALALGKRQSGNCQNGLTSCSGFNAPNVCCPSDTVCAVDDANNVACCPINAHCTGTIRGGTQAASTPTSSTSSGFVAGGTTSSSSSSFFFGSTATTTTTTSSAGVTITGSTIPNAPFPFVIIPTTFPGGAAECSSYYTGCQSQFEQCTSSLGLGVNGVTVSGANGGVSVNGVTATGAAASVCSSLSTAACFGLQPSNCATFGGATGTNTGATSSNGNNFVVSTGAAARPTRCVGQLYEIGMGVAVGVAGALI